MADKGRAGSTEMHEKQAPKESGTHSGGGGAHASHGKAGGSTVNGHGGHAKHHRHHDGKVEFGSEGPDGFGSKEKRPYGHTGMVPSR